MDGFRDALDGCQGVVVEPAGAAALAGYLRQQPRLVGKTVGVVVSGGISRRSTRESG
jgi:threonine dehydratase